jgi:hypothetical protein
MMVLRERSPNPKVRPYTNRPIYLIRRFFASYISYYQEDRTHLGLGRYLRPRTVKPEATRSIINIGSLARQKLGLPGIAISLWGTWYQANRRTSFARGTAKSTVWGQMEVLMREPQQTRRNPSQVAHTLLANVIPGLLFRKGSFRVRSRGACRLRASKSKKSGSIASQNAGAALLIRQKTSRWCM